MHISEYFQYAVASRSQAGSSRFTTTIASGNELKDHIQALTVDISMIHTYEIYTKNPETLENGWDIKLVRSTDNLIKHFPLFDCIITKNDTPESECEDYLDFNFIK